MPSIYDPIRVGPITIPNRIVRTAHGTHFTHPRAPYMGATSIACHRERAIGGVGLTILGGVRECPVVGYVRLGERIGIAGGRVHAHAAEPYG